MPELSCPRCQSSAVQRFAMLYKAGTTNSSSVTTATAVSTSDGGYVQGSASTSTESMTKLAAETAPPPRKNVTSPFVWAVISGVGLFSTFGMPGNWRIIWLVVLLVSAPLAFTRKRYNRDVLPPLMAKWDRSFLCTRCGESFEVAV
jgi:hypothetical protein